MAIMETIGRHWVLGQVNGQGSDLVSEELVSSYKATSPVKGQRRMEVAWINRRHTDLRIPLLSIVAMWGCFGVRSGGGREVQWKVAVVSC